MTKNEIYNHIVNRGHEQVHITHGLVYHWCHTFNKAIFEDTLIIPQKFVYVKDKDTLGWFQEFPTSRKNKYVIALNGCRLQERSSFLTVLVHELVHLHQAIHAPKDKAHHGKYFFSFRDVIEAAGMPLEKSYWFEEFDEETIHKQRH